jgi:hypothetical protein
MPNSNSSSSSGGIGFAGVLALIFITLKLTGFLALIFITLKLTGFLAWSWWWVLAPLWIPAAIVSAVGFAALVIYLIATK